MIPLVGRVAARQRVVDAWCDEYPAQIGLLYQHPIDSECSKRSTEYFQDLLHTVRNTAKNSNDEEWETSTAGFFEEYCAGTLVSELLTFRDMLSKAEALKDHPTVFGDFLYRLLFLSRALELPSRAFLADLGLSNVYFSFLGKPTSFLEWICSRWGMELERGGSCIRATKTINTEVTLNHPLKHLFRFDPNQFVPSILHQISSMRSFGASELWAEPLLSLPTLFCYSQTNCQNFDKQLLTTLQGYGDPTNPSPLNTLILQSLGLFITWSANIHKFASLNDQKRIELFHFAITGDEGATIFGLPVEIFRKIFEDHFCLGNRHKKCTTCTGPWRPQHGRFWHGWSVCCQESCGCVRDSDNNYLEVCPGKNPFLEMWGIQAGLWKQQLKSYETFLLYASRDEGPTLPRSGAAVLGLEAEEDALRSFLDD